VRSTALAANFFSTPPEEAMILAALSLASLTCSALNGEEVVQSESPINFVASRDLPNFSRSVRVTGTGSVQVLMGFNDGSFEFKDTNDAGHVLSVQTDGYGRRRGYLAVEGKLREIGDANWTYVDPIAVSANGTVVGTARDGRRAFPFVWRDGSWREVQIARAKWAYPAGVSDDGSVLVKATYDGGGRRSFVVQPDGTATEISFSGHAFQVIRMTRGAQVLAYVYGQDRTRTVVWERGKVREISVPKARNVYGWDLNDAGTVVGVAFNGAGKSFGFVHRAGQVKPLDLTLRPQRVSHVPVSADGQLTLAVAPLG